MEGWGTGRGQISQAILLERKILERGRLGRERGGGKGKIARLGLGVDDHVDDVRYLLA
jgi:hypothetical protein